jgi:hypothetical protein
MGVSGRDAIMNQRNVRQLPALKACSKPDVVGSLMSQARTNSGRAMSGRLTEFHRLDGIERTATKAALDRCRALAEQIERELMKKNAANFQNLTVLADFQASFERAAEVLERTDGFRQIALD